MRTPKDKKDPKLRILKAAAALFSKKGFAAVGVREISKKANVNISMISYYYGGKVGLLKSIIEFYNDRMKELSKEITSQKLPPDQQLKLVISKMIKLIRTYPDISRVAMIEMPLDLQELEQLQVNMIVNTIDMVKHSFHTPAAHHGQDMESHIIIGPALLSLIFSNLLMGDIITKAYNSIFDDKFYEKYINTLTTLFLKGITGIAEENRKMREMPAELS